MWFFAIFYIFILQWLQQCQIIFFNLKHHFNPEAMLVNFLNLADGWGNWKYA